MTFLHQKYHKLTPYTPGEQVDEQAVIKLNTNESPYPPA
ncbi:MAG TPA: histidinol-phosphate transaminase, partial [Enterococcus sp.]|nr:histidinol-phosphate transaminase [Enterococcus sp.]